MADTAVSGLGQQLLDDHFRPFVITLAELMMSDASLRVDEIEGRPIFVLESAPYCVVAVDRDWIDDFHVRCLSANIVDVLFETELGRVHTDHYQSSILVFRGPRADIRKGTEPIDAGIGPDVDDDDFSAQVGRRQRLRIEPACRA